MAKNDLVQDFSHLTPCSVDEPVAGIKQILAE